MSAGTAVAVAQAYLLALCPQRCCGRSRPSAAMRRRLHLKPSAHDRPRQRALLRPRWRPANALQDTNSNLSPQAKLRGGTAAMHTATSAESGRCIIPERRTTIAQSVATTYASTAGQRYIIIYQWLGRLGFSFVYTYFFHGDK